MKIVFIGGRDIRLLGGIENYMYNLATELVQMGHTPIVYCESDHNSVEIVNGFEVRCVKGLNNRFLCKPWVSLKASLRIVLKKADVDIIHYNAWPPSLWSWIPRIFGIPSLMEGHGLEWQRTKYGKLEQKIMKFMERFTASINKNLVMCSQDQVKYFMESYGKHPVCIPGGINLPKKDCGLRSNILQKYSLEQNKYFLFLGRLVQDKNPDYLIRAYLNANLSGYKLVVAGDNSAMPEYVNFLHGITNCKNVVFTGAVYGDDKDALMRNAFAFCLPSTIEGLSIVLMEAMSFQVPIIASDIQANRELLFGNAIYVKPESEEELLEALRRSIDFKEFPQFVHNNYINIRDNYTWPIIADRYVRYLSTILSSNKL